MFDRASIPDKKPLCLSEHRILTLRDGKLAILASKHTGWVIIEERDYASLTHWLSKSIKLEDTSLSQTSTLNVLWHAGLLVAQGDLSSASTIIKKKKITTLLLKVTGSCNFQCTYCYDYEAKRFKTRLSTERTVSVISEILNTQDDLNIAFHGGEPLLRFDFIKQIVEFIEKNHQHKKIKYTIQTNGSLFTQEIVDFLETKKFTVGISFDGKTYNSNKLRIGPRGSNSFDVLQHLLKNFGEFIRRRCGVLAVVSQSSINEIPDFAIWLQDQGFRSLSLAFMDATGKGLGLTHEVPSPKDAALLYARLVKLIQGGEISKINISSLVSYIDNLFSFIPRDFCNRGPCAAANEFLVLDSENKLRSCDIIYDPFFEIGDATQNPNDDTVLAAREKIGERHIWLKSFGNSCSTCALFGLCGGTCVGKAISSTGSSHTVDQVTCSIAKFIYPTILEEIANIGLDSGPLISYYRKHVLPN
ncbi:radical SAM/SPASM domain-containing protein [Variovorax sp. IB41]|uniref:radical SAM/SPASM domain-containing protein n=1 Tax=Variovorax sp. IB41 TaxID=2779370 RepID=UPI0018E7E184|nr:radical SAM protein [Variovorax sp. IB41]MBJ2157937.1 radical SAM protein [Variovorax sp. IB41]